MKKKNLKWLIILIVGFGIIIFLLTRIKEKPFNQIELEKNNVIMNKTEITYYDTILHVGLNELGIEGTYLIIKDFKGATVGELDLQAYILGNEFQYMVYMKNLSRAKAIEFLAHELIHLKQYREERLKTIDNEHIEWEGEVMNGMEIPYKQRPWEEEAFAMQHKLEQKIREVLYE